MKEDIKERIEKEISIYYLDYKFNISYIRKINRKYNGKLLLKYNNDSIDYTFIINNKIIFKIERPKVYFEYLRRKIKYKPFDIKSYIISNLCDNNINVIVKGDIDNLENNSYVNNIENSI